MATKAYILIETSVGRTKEVANSLRNVDGINSVDNITGPYDIVAFIEAEDINSMGNMVTDEIHTLSGVVRTVTCIVVGV